MIPSQSDLSSIKDALAYEPETGVLIWKVSAGTAAKWTVAGHATRDGYIVVRVNGKLYKAHNLAYYLYHGIWPDKEIDHINRNPADNRIINLRLATRSENSRNIRLPKHNTSGFKGVSFYKRNRKFLVRIGVNGKNKFIGYYDSAYDAAMAYDAAAILLHGPFASLNFPRNNQ